MAGWLAGPARCQPAAHMQLRPGRTSRKVCRWLAAPERAILPACCKLELMCCHPMHRRCAAGANRPVESCSQGGECRWAGGYNVVMDPSYMLTNPVCSCAEKLGGWGCSTR